MQGPLKGEIQEFSDYEIVIGRMPSCHVRFPAELAVVSREHAKIVREGNRFKLVDQSANGTLVNGKMVKEKEVYLKDGDVLDFAQGGPKVSFLTRMGEASGRVESAPVPVTSRKEPPDSGAPELKSTTEALIPVTPRKAPPAQPEHIVGPEARVQRVQAPVVIQYGPTLQSFKEVPVTIGTSPKADFAIVHPAVLELHSQIFFYQNQYWVKDLTGQNKLLINKLTIGVQAPLSADDELALSPEGPFFRFLGGGRFAEEEVAPPEEPLDEGAELDDQEVTQRHEPEVKTDKGPRSILKKFLR